MTRRRNPVGKGLVNRVKSRQEIAAENKRLRQVLVHLSITVAKLQDHFKLDPLEVQRVLAGKL